MSIISTLLARVLNIAITLVLKHGILMLKWLDARVSPSQQMRFLALCKEGDTRMQESPPLCAISITKVSYELGWKQILLVSLIWLCV